MMFKVITSAERHTSDRGWIHSEFSLSYSDYDDPSNAHFGCLLVHNDNTLKPLEGFKSHPHHDLELVSYIISGTLRHTDDLGNETDLEAGSVQVMSAGTGVKHAEMNPSMHEPVRFIQMWFLPDSRMTSPAWQSRKYGKEQQSNNLLHVVSGAHQDGEDILPIHQDVNVYLSRLDPKEVVDYATRNERRTHIFVMSGCVEIRCEERQITLSSGDAVRMKQQVEISIRGTGNGEPAEFILIDMP